MNDLGFGIKDARRAPTGIEGLDRILSGGLTESRLYLVEGTPGIGKTTLALKMLSTPGAGYDGGAVAAGRR